MKNSDLSQSDSGQQGITPAAAMRGIGMGLFAGALFVCAALVLETTIIRDFRK